MCVDESDLESSEVCKFPMLVFLRVGSLVGCHLWGHTESDMTEVT